MALEQGETAVALLLLWEADHGCPYPSLAGELMGRVSTFCKRLKEAVTADDELKAWLEYKQMRVALTTSLPATMHVRWSVAIDPAVGEPYPRGSPTLLHWWFGGTLRFLPLFLLAPLLHPPLLVVGLHVRSA